MGCSGCWTRSPPCAAKSWGPGRPGQQHATRCGSLGGLHAFMTGMSDLDGQMPLWRRFIWPAAWHGVSTPVIVSQVQLIFGRARNLECCPV